MTQTCLILESKILELCSEFGNDNNGKVDKTLDLPKYSKEVEPMTNLEEEDKRLGICYCRFLFVASFLVASRYF